MSWAGQEQAGGWAVLGWGCLSSSQQKPAGTGDHSLSLINSALCEQGVCAKEDNRPKQPLGAGSSVDTLWKKRVISQS